MGGDDHHRAAAAGEPTRTAGRQRFPKNSRLLRRREFLAVQTTGRAVHGRQFLAVVAPTPEFSSRGPTGDEQASRGRIGITVSKRVGNAVTRNRIRRLVREFVRRERWVPAGYDVVVIAKQSAASLTGYAEVAAALSALQARLVPRSRAPARSREKTC